MGRQLPGLYSGQQCLGQWPSHGRSGGKHSTNTVVDIFILILCACVCVRVVHVCACVCVRVVHVCACVRVCVLEQQSIVHCQ